MSRHPWRYVLLVLLPLAYLSGCGPSDLPVYPVNGQVIYKDDGAPLTEGCVIVFDPQDPLGTQVTALVEKEGKFTLPKQASWNGAIASKYLVFFAPMPNQEHGLENLRKLMDVKYTNKKTSDIIVEVLPVNENIFKIEVERPVKS